MRIDLRQTDRQTEKQTDRQTEKQTDRKTDRQADRQTDRKTLPIRNGGFGMSSMVSTCPIAFVSSWARSLAHLPQSFGDLTDLIKNISRAVQHPGHNGSIASHLLQALPGNKSLGDLINNPKKLQQKLKSEQTEQIVSSILSNPLSQRSAARFRSLQGLGAGVWLDSIPSSAKLALKPSDFRLATRMRLGLEMPLGSVVPICECGKDIDKDGYHLLTCKTGGGPIWTHETLTSVWSDCLQHLKMSHQREPRNLYVNSDDRPDIVVFDAQQGCDIELDISVAHPWALHVISRAAQEDGAAAATREVKKSEKYARERIVWGLPSNCIPLVFKHFGRWGSEAAQFLHRLSLQSIDEDGRKNSRDFKTFWRRCMSVALQRWNASVISRKLARLGHCKIFTVDSSFARS